MTFLKKKKSNSIQLSCQSAHTSIVLIIKKKIISDDKIVGQKCNCSKFFSFQNPVVTFTDRAQRRSKTEKEMKGTVTSLSSVFPAEETQKAAKRVQDAIAEKHQELERLGDFISDNTNLVSLVQRLPDHLHHDIMESSSILYEFHSL